MFIRNKDLNALFDRLRIVEQEVAVQEEKDINLLEAFAKHDKEEMIKYEIIQKRLNSMDKENKEDRKYRNYVVGALITFETLSRLGYISI